MELAEILRRTRAAIREHAGDDADRLFYANRYVFARLQLDERKVKTGIKKRLTESNRTCVHCGARFKSKMVPPGQDGVGTTHAGNRYDHFLISQDLADEEAMTCRIETYSGDDLALAEKVSDHLPVIAWFKTEESFRDRE